MAVPRGYTTVNAVAAYRGITFTTAQADLAESLLASAEAYIDRRTRRRWLPSPITNELYDLSNAGITIYLRSAPVTSIQQIETRTYAPGDVPYVLTAGTEYELIDQTSGLVSFSTTYGGAFYSGYDNYGGSLIYNEAGSLLNVGYSFGLYALISYTPVVPVPDDIALAAQMLIAHWMDYNISPSRYGVSQMKTADQALTLTDQNGAPVIPPEAECIIQGYRKVLF